MKQVISSERLPIKMWLDDIEEGALEQAKHLANLPFAFKHVAVMPDSHQGFGMPIGGVLASHGVIIPNAVGVDIVQRGEMLRHLDNVFNNLACPVL